MRRTSWLAAAVIVAAGCGGGETTRAPTATHAARAAPPPRIHATLTADSHAPRVGRPWHYVVRVRDAAGRPVPARIHLQILFGSVPVGQVGVHRVRDGVWQETIGDSPANPPFPAAARGRPLVFQAVVTAKGQTVRLNWPVRVR